jgi:hypothetical protein
MSIPKLFTIMIAIAVLFAPAFTTSMPAYAAVPDHHVQMMEKGHCEPATDIDKDSMADMACCGDMCMAVAVAPPASQMVKPLVGSVPAAGLQEFQTGIPAELATPPPRAA